MGNYIWIRGEVGGPVGSLIGFRNATWSLIQRGQHYVAEDNKHPRAQYYGKRIAFWARLRHRTSGLIVFFVNHHGPLPLNSGGWCGHASTVYNLLHVIATNAESGDAVLLVGDFNSNSDSNTIRQLSTRLNRVHHGAVYNGIDNIFTNLPSASVVCTGNLGPGGSDHDAINVVLDLSSAAAPVNQEHALCSMPAGYSPFSPGADPTA